MSVKKFKKDGVIFRVGLCTRQSKELHVSGFKIPKLIKESEKTFLKLKLGYKIIALDGEGAEGAAGAGAGDEAAWKKLKAELSRKIKPPRTKK